MSWTVDAQLRGAAVVPLLRADDARTAVGVARALYRGGLPVIEVVLRTPAALECLSAVVSQVPETTVGAGTVLSREQAVAAVDAGARFIVSPGLDEGVVDAARAADRPVYPGIATASELQRAWNMGLRSVKFFPAAQAGGLQLLRALADVFYDVSFFATGGISPQNLADYLAVPSVLACGGSWLTPAAAVAAGDFERITALAAEAAALAADVRRC